MKTQPVLSSTPPTTKVFSFSSSNHLFLKCGNLNCRSGFFSLRKNLENKKAMTFSRGKVPTKMIRTHDREMYMGSSREDVEKTEREDFSCVYGEED